MKKTIEKRFKCICGYVSPAGYKVDAVTCPFCKRDMQKIMVWQYKTHFVEVKHENNI